MGQENDTKRISLSETSIKSNGLFEYPYLFYKSKLKILTFLVCIYILEVFSARNIDTILIVDAISLDNSAQVADLSNLEKYSREIYGIG